LKQSGFLIVNDTHKPLCFNVGPQGKKGLATFLGLYLKRKHPYLVNRALRFHRYISPLTELLGTGKKGFHEAVFFRHDLSMSYSGQPPGKIIGGFGRGIEKCDHNERDISEFPAHERLASNGANPIVLPLALPVKRVS
jgi:hypothetical protein